MKDIKWLGNSYKNILNFPKDAKREAGYQLDKVQRGEEPSDWKPMHSIGIGVKEIRIHCENEYRIIYITKFKNSIYVLHCFTKKGMKTNKNDISLAKNRLKQIRDEVPL